MPWYQTYGSGECIGDEKCLIYCVHWKTRNARLARKSRADNSPATGLSWKPVLSAKESEIEFRTSYGYLLYTPTADKQF